MSFSLMFDTVMIFTLSAFLAEVMGTLSGFGSSSILLPFAHQLFDYKNAIMIVAIYHIFGNVTRLFLFFKYLDNKIFILFGLPSVIATLVGASLVSTFPTGLLKILLGIILIFFALFSLIRPTWHRVPTPAFGRIGGALSGFLAGLIGTGGVIRGAFLTMFGLSKERYIATIASIALLVDITRIPIYFSEGFLGNDMYKFIPVLFLIAFIGSWIGKKVMQSINNENMRKIIHTMIIIMASYLIYQGYTSVK